MEKRLKNLILRLGRTSQQCTEMEPEKRPPRVVEVTKELQDLRQHIAECRPKFHRQVISGEDRFQINQIKRKVRFQAEREGQHLSAFSRLGSHKLDLTNFKAVKPLSTTTAVPPGELHKGPGQRR